MATPDDLTSKLPPLKPKKKRRRPPQSPLARRAFETSVLRLLAIDMTPEQIASKLDVPSRWITPIVHKAEQGFKKLSSEATDMLRGKEIALIEHLQSEALEAYEKSKAPRKTTVVEGTPDANAKDRDGNPTARPRKIVQTTEQRNGDVKCLDTIARLRERFAKVTGIDQPVELKHVHARYQEGRELLFTALRNVTNNDVELLRKLAVEIERLEAESTIGKEVAAV